MSPEDFKMITGIGAILWGASALGIFFIQALVWPDDGAKRTAMLATFSIALLCLRLSLSYIFGFSMGTNEQGIWVFLGGGLFWVGFFFFTWMHNVGLYGKRFREIIGNVKRRFTGG